MKLINYRQVWVTKEEYFYECKWSNGTTTEEITLPWDNMFWLNYPAIKTVTVEDVKEGRGEDQRDIRKVKFDLHNKGAYAPTGSAVNIQVNGNGTTMQTVWHPTPDEIAKLAAGTPIYLTLVGIAWPPVQLQVGDVPKVTE